jgi:hypothetical protein
MTKHIFRNKGKFKVSENYYFLVIIPSNLPTNNVLVGLKVWRRRTILPLPRSQPVELLTAHSWTRTICTECCTFFICSRQLSPELLLVNVVGGGATGDSLPGPSLWPPETTPLRRGELSDPGFPHGALGCLGSGFSSCFRRVGAGISQDGLVRVWLWSMGSGVEASGLLPASCFSCFPHFVMRERLVARIDGLGRWNAKICCLDIQYVALTEELGREIVMLICVAWIEEEVRNLG